MHNVVNNIHISRLLLCELWWKYFSS